MNWNEVLLTWFLLLSTRICQYICLIRFNIYFNFLIIDVRLVQDDVLLIRLIGINVRHADLKSVFKWEWIKMVSFFFKKKKIENWKWKSFSFSVQIFICKLWRFGCAKINTVYISLGIIYFFVSYKIKTFTFSFVFFGKVLKKKIGKVVL